MKSADFALVSLAVVFGVYFVYCSVFVGLSSVRLLPKRFGKAKREKYFKNSRLLYAELLLILGVLALVAFFPDPANALWVNAKAVLLVGLLGVIIRGGMFYGLNKTKDKQPIWQDCLYLAGSLAAALALPAVGVYMLFGLNFWSFGGGWLAMVAAASAAKAVGYCLVDVNRQLQQIAAGFWLLFGACLWPLYLAMVGSHVLGYWLGLWLSFVVVAVAVVVVTDGMAGRSYLRLAIPALCLIGVPAIAAANNPYIIYPVYKTVPSFSASRLVAELVAVGLVGLSGVVLVKLAQAAIPKKLLRYDS